MPEEAAAKRLFSVRNKEQQRNGGIQAENK